MRTFFYLLFGCCFMVACGKITSKPNIVLIVADDLGYNDVSWHNPDIISPNLEKLARQGVILENHYVQPICTPTRSALMTGYYPIHTGRQSSVLWPQEPRGLFTNFTLMPEYLKQLGYSTHAIGKWHLGFCDDAYLPNSRGFDTFRGFYNGDEEYFSHTRRPTVGGGLPGYDYRNNTMIDYSANNTYSSYLIANTASELIKNHSQFSKNKPMFLYLPFQDVHAPLEAPQKFLDLYPNIENAARKKLSAMVSALDAAVGQIISSLKMFNMYDDTLIVFTADNGGQVLSGGNNFPLRGNKGTIWEGGTRSAAFIHAPKLLKRQGEVSNNLIHVTDWLPTFISAAGGISSKMLPNIDGIDQWKSLLANKTSPRTEMLYNIDPGSKFYENDSVNDGQWVNGGIRVNEMKLLIGDIGKPDGWIPPPSVVEVFNSNREIDSLQDIFTTEPCLNPNGLKIQLYNLTADPYEKHDIASLYPEVVDDLMLKLKAHGDSMIPPDNAPEIKDGNPNSHGGIYGPGWCKAQP